jgi:hypothetical protein
VQIVQEKLFKKLLLAEICQILIFDDRNFSFLDWPEILCYGLGNQSQNTSNEKSIHSA